MNGEPRIFSDVLPAVISDTTTCTSLPMMSSDVIRIRGRLALSPSPENVTVYTHTIVLHSVTLTATVPRMSSASACCI